MKDKISLFWFRRDLRLEDNTGLREALKSGVPIMPVFIFDTDILSRLENRDDRRVDYIQQALQSINEALKPYGARLNTFMGTPLSVFEKLSEEYEIEAVYCNRDYEPYARERDAAIRDFLQTRGILFKSFKDQVIFEEGDILKNDGKPYTVYTPYAKKWRALLAQNPLQAQEEKALSANFYPQETAPIHTLAAIGFSKSDFVLERPELRLSIIGEYHKYRDFPALQRTTQLGIALRFGTISIRKCVAFALEHNDTWLAELIWREFFMQILFHFPHVVDQSFKPKYDAIRWRNNEADFQRWQEGTTGYPIVDAGMRQLNTTGFMHNRVRMVVGSFLCKHLLTDWRWGETYFAQKLNDYDLSANNGNWQWAAGCGCDAAPYFRVFSPAAQTEKFDKDERYIQQWVPEYKSSRYPAPMIAHEVARERALATYRKALKTEAVNEEE